MVDAYDGLSVFTEFFAKPFGESPSSPVPARTRRRLNLCGYASSIGHEHADSLATGVGSLSAGIINSDVAFDRGMFVGVLLS